MKVKQNFETSTLGTTTVIFWQVRQATSAAIAIWAFLHEHLQQVIDTC